MCETCENDAPNLRETWAAADKKEKEFDMDVQGLDQVADSLAIGIRQLRKNGFKVVADFGSGLTDAQKDARARFAACALLGLGEQAHSDYHVGVVARALLQNSIDSPQAFKSDSVHVIPATQTMADFERKSS